MHIRATVLLALSSRRSFLDHYYDQGSPGVFVPGYTNQAVGADVDIEIAFAEEQIVFHSRGLVRSKRLVGRRDMPAGIGIEFLGSERSTRDLLLKFANGHDVKLTKRKSRRLPMSLQVELVHQGKPQLLSTEDLSREGAFVRTDTPPAKGSMVRLRFRPPGVNGIIDVEGEVMWQRHSERPGIGVRFVIDNSDGQRQLTAFIDKVKDRLKT